MLESIIILMVSFLGYLMMLFRMFNYIVSNMMERWSWMLIG